MDCVIRLEDRDGDVEMYSIKLTYTHGALKSEISSGKQTREQYKMILENMKAYRDYSISIPISCGSIDIILKNGKINIGFCTSAGNKDDDHDLSSSIELPFEDVIPTFQKIVNFLDENPKAETI